MTEFKKPQTTEEMQLAQVQSMFKKGVRASSFRPEEQAAPWLLEGLRWLERGDTLTVEDMKKIGEMGGVTNPDTSLRTVDTKYMSKLPNRS